MHRFMCGTPASSNGYDFGQAKIDRCTAFEAAKKAIGPEATKVILLVYEDWPLRWIQRWLQIACHRTATNRVRKHADALADHYAEVDKERGRSWTPFTREAAIKLVDPDDPEP